VQAGLLRSSGLNTTEPGYFPFGLVGFVAALDYKTDRSLDDETASLLNAPF
jgi:hypothetical protein